MPDLHVFLAVALLPKALCTHQTLERLLTRMNPRVIL